MYSVTNTIHIETPYSEKMIERFASTHTKDLMQDVDGFISFQLMSRELPDEEGVTELVVLSLWESKEQQKNWVKSEAFKKVHQRDSADKKEEKPKRSGFIRNSIAEFDVLV